MDFSEAIDEALGQAMADDARIVVMGEDVHTLRLNILNRFGGERVRSAPVSESAFLGAAVGAAMAGLRPVVELMLIDFIGVAADALLNQAAKVETFSGGRWKVPLVVRAACGGGYGDAGQHEQTLWGWLAHIPGLTVVVPSNPADAGSLMLAAIEDEGPVVFLEHKLLSTSWLEYMGGSWRKTVRFDVPPAGIKDSVPEIWTPLPFGQAHVLREGKDITLVGVAVSVHRAMEASVLLEAQGISAGVLDLRTVFPLDKNTLVRTVSTTGRLLVVDEDYQGFGLSGELAAVLLEEGVSFRYGRVCTEGTIPYSRELEDKTLPSTDRIVEEAHRLTEKSSSSAESGSST